MAKIYCLTYTLTLSSSSRSEQETFIAADDSAAVTEANRRLGLESRAVDLKLFDLGTEVSL